MIVAATRVPDDDDDDDGIYGCTSGCDTCMVSAVRHIASHVAARSHVRHINGKMVMRSHHDVYNMHDTSISRDRRSLHDADMGVVAAVLRNDAMTDGQISSDKHSKQHVSNNE